VVYRFASCFVVEKQGLRIGRVGPAKRLFDVGSVLLGQANAGLVIPDGIAKIAIFIEGLIYRLC
jgi:hypothetical protein